MTNDSYGPAICIMILHGEYSVNIIPTRFMIKGAREDSRTKVNIDHFPCIPELSVYALRAENTMCIVSSSVQDEG